MVNLPPRKSVCTPPVLRVIEELVNRICRRSPGDTTLTVFQGHERKLTVHELNRKFRLKKKQTKKKLAYLCTRSCFCVETAELKRKTEKMRRVSHETPFSMAFSVLRISPN